MVTRAAYREHLRKIYHLSSALWLLEWDQETSMGPRGIDARAEVIGQLTKERFELSVAPELGTWLEALRNDASLTLEEKASLRVVGREYGRQKAIPASFVEAFAKVKSKAQAAWAKAREASDFSLFLPHLEHIVGHTRQLAEYYGYKEHPYDALLGDYEPGMTAARLQTIAEPLRAGLVPFIARLRTEGTDPDVSPIEGTFNLDTQRALSRRALEAIGYDFEAGALHDVEHPFTTAIAYGDVRVTNSYQPNSLVYGLFGALHEGGHALYHQGMPEDLYLLRLEDGSSAGIDESQSLMMENQVGRGRAFWTFFQPILAKAFPAFRDTAPEALYRAVNRVEPGLIRLVADELTYNLHIMLRLELEMALVAGEISPEDLPSQWNDGMERYLGVRPTSDANGVLQDVHWSFGYFGYFPTYMLGSLYAAQIWAALLHDVPDVEARIAAGDFSLLLDWLRETVHCHGAVYDPDDLIVQVTGQPLDPSYFLNHVTAKYSEIYQLSSE